MGNCTDCCCDCSSGTKPAKPPKTSWRDRLRNKLISILLRLAGIKGFWY